MINKRNIVVFVIIILIVSFSVSVQAAPSPGEISIDDNIKGAEDLKDIGNNVFGIIQIVGIVSSVIILSVIGFKIMTGSIEEKAKYKSKLMPYVIGAIILFAAPTIANIVYEYATNQEKTEIPNGDPGPAMPGLGPGSPGGVVRPELK